MLQSLQYPEGFPCSVKLHLALVEGLLRLTLEVLIVTGPVSNVEEGEAVEQCSLLF